MALGWILALASAAEAQAVLPPDPRLDYLPLDFGTASTFLTGIRGTNVVGNSVIPGGQTGGLYYDGASGLWSALPATTENGSNYPGAIGSSPYGPSFGTPGGVLRVVGSYKTDAAPVDLGYLYDGAAAPGTDPLTLVYPDPDTGFTIAHSTFGDTVVGNYDTGPLTGNAFIYDIPSGTYVTNNRRGAVSTTAYGVWGDKIAGGYGALGPDREPGFEHGYIYDMRTGRWTTHDHPDAVFTISRASPALAAAAHTTSWRTGSATTGSCRRRCCTSTPRGERPGFRSPFPARTSPRPTRSTRTG